MNETLKQFLAGGLAGAVSRTAVSPLERTKILFQVQTKQSRISNSIIKTLIQIYKEEGFLGFFRGNGTNVIRIIPYSAIQFATYENCKLFLETYYKEQLDTPARLVAGGVAGLTCVTITYPLDLVRTRMSLAHIAYMKEKNTNGAATRVPGIWASMKNIYLTEGGLPGLWKGILPTAIGIAPYVAINFAFFELFCTYFISLKQKRMGDNEKALNSNMIRLSSGACAGAVAQTVTYPFEMLRRRFQVIGMTSSYDVKNKSQFAYRGVMDALKTIVSTEGIAGLYIGMLPNLLKVVPATGVSFLVYETSKSALGI
ncbi:hypothetical protein HDU92_007792 [Lobulomyces angularis]|nr:hypothetical protein HDU92_007792 [Lobulomyces angularis]